MALSDRPQPPSLEEMRDNIKKQLKTDQSTSLLEILALVEADITRKNQSTPLPSDQETIDAIMRNDEY